MDKNEIDSDYELFQENVKQQGGKYYSFWLYGKEYYATESAAKALCGGTIRLK